MTRIHGQPSRASCWDEVDDEVSSIAICLARSSYMIMQRLYLFLIGWGLQGYATRSWIPQFRGLPIWATRMMTPGAHSNSCWWQLTIVIRNLFGLVQTYFKNDTPWPIYHVAMIALTSLCSHPPVCYLRLLWFLKATTVLYEGNVTQCSQQCLRGSAGAGKTDPWELEFYLCHNEYLMLCLVWIFKFATHTSIETDK